MVRFCRLLKKELPLPRQSIFLVANPLFQLFLLHTLPVLEVEGSVPCALPVVLVGWHPITPPLPRRSSPDSTSCLPGLPRSCSPWLSVPRSTGRSLLYASPCEMSSSFASSSALIKNAVCQFFVLSLSVSFRCRFILADFRQAYPLCGAVPSPCGALASFRKVLAVWVSLAVIQFH